MQLISLKCPSCGAVIRYTAGQKQITCDYCDSVLMPEQMPKEAFGSEATVFPEQQPTFVYRDTPPERQQPETLDDAPAASAFVFTQTGKFRKKLNVTAIMMLVSSMLMGTINRLGFLPIFMLFLSAAIFLVAPLLLAREKPGSKKTKVWTAVKLYMLYFLLFWIGFVLGVILFYKH